MAEVVALPGMAYSRSGNAPAKAKRKAPARRKPDRGPRAAAAPAPLSLRAAKRDVFDLGATGLDKRQRKIRDDARLAAIAEAVDPLCAALRTHTQNARVAEWCCRGLQHALVDAPSRAVCGVRQLMLVCATTCARKSLRSVMLVLTATLFSHSNSAHIERNASSEHVAGRM